VSVCVSLSACPSVCVSVCLSPQILFRWRSELVAYNNKQTIILICLYLFLCYYCRLSCFAFTVAVAVCQQCNKWRYNTMQYFAQLSVNKLYFYQITLKHGPYQVFKPNWTKLLVITINYQTSKQVFCKAAMDINQSEHRLPSLPRLPCYRKVLGTTSKWPFLVISCSLYKCTVGLPSVRQQLDLSVGWSLTNTLAFERFYSAIGYIWALEILHNNRQQTQ